MGFGPALAWLKALCVLGLSTGRICAQPETDPITSGLLNMDPPPTRRRQRFGWSDVEVFRSVSGRVRIVRIALDFCQNLLIFAGSDRISKRAWLISTSLGRFRRDLGRSQRDQARSRRDLARSRRDLGRSQRDQARSRRDPARSQRDQARSRRDLARSRQIGQDHTGELLHRRRKLFRCISRSGRLKSVFHALTRQPTRRARILGSGIRRRPSPASGRTVLGPDRPGWPGGSGTGSGWTPLLVISWSSWKFKVLSETHSSSPNSSFPPPLGPLPRVSSSTVWILHEGIIPFLYLFFVLP